MTRSIIAILFLLFSNLHALPIDQTNNTKSATRYIVKERETITLKCPQISTSELTTTAAVNLAASSEQDDGLVLYDSNKETDLDENDLLESDFERKRRENDNSIQIIQWFKDAQRIYKQTSSTRYKLLVNNDLRIKNVNMNDAGLFKCKQINGFGGSVVHSLNLIVESSNSNNNNTLAAIRSTTTTRPGVKEFNTPVFTDKTQQKHFRKQKGSDLKLKCRAAGLPKPDIVWLKNGEVLSEEEYGITRSKWTLDLKDLRMSDTGNFTCQVFNKYGFINATFELNVYEESQTIEDLDPLNATIIAGMDAIFTCKIKSSTQVPDIKWMKQISKLEYTNYVHQNQLSSSSSSFLNANDDLLKNFYQQPTTQASLVDTKDSNLFSINDLLSSEQQLQQPLDSDDDLKLFSLNKDLKQTKSHKSDAAAASSANTDESVHYITLTSSPQVDQQTLFNKLENAYISKLIIKQASVRDTGVYVCFGGAGDSNTRKSYLKVLPSQYASVNPMSNQFTKLINSNVKSNNRNDLESASNYQSLGFLIVIVPVLLVVSFSIISICYLKQMNHQKKSVNKTNSVLKSLCACCVKPTNVALEEEDINSFKRAKRSKFTGFTSASSVRTTSGSENGTTKSSLGSSLSTDSSSTTATTVAYYTTIPLLNENNQCSPPKLPSTQPPSFHNVNLNKDCSKLLERCTSTPSMAYYKIVDNDLIVDPVTRQPINTIRHVNDDTATCVSSNSRLYYQLTPLPVVHHYNFR